MLDSIFDYVFQVQLSSTRLHGTFLTVQAQPGTGMLDLFRRCSSQTCEGHCTCAPQDRTCDRFPAFCSNVKGMTNSDFYVAKFISLKLI